jgi:hypothetical protein
MALRLLVIAGLASSFAFGFPPPSTGHDWYKGLTNSAGVACCGSAECRPAAARYNERAGFWETEVIEDTWLPVPPGALALTPSPDGNYHVCEHAGTIRCFFQPGHVQRDPRDGAKQPSVAHGLTRFLHASHRPAREKIGNAHPFSASIITAAASKSGHRPHAVCGGCRSRVVRRQTDLSRRRFLLSEACFGNRRGQSAGPSLMHDVNDIEAVGWATDTRKTATSRTFRTLSMSARAPPPPPPARQVLLWRPPRTGDSNRARAGRCGAASSVQRSSVILPSFPFELQPLRNAGLRQ